MSVLFLYDSDTGFKGISPGEIPKRKVLPLERLPLKDKSHLDIVNAESFVETKWSECFLGRQWLLQGRAPVCLFPEDLSVILLSLTTSSTQPSLQLLSRSPVF